MPSLLALVHILTLGWITTPILGAAFQLVPVALQVGLYSERLALIGYGLWNGASSWAQSPFCVAGPMTVGGVALSAGVWLFLLNMALVATR
jgi:hypothetical protein